jgi:hypothetical protein
MGEEWICNSTWGRRQGRNGRYECTCKDEELGYGRSATLTTSCDTGGVQPCRRSCGGAGKTLATSTVTDLFETRQPGEDGERIRNDMEERNRVPEKTMRNAADESRGSVVDARDPLRRRRRRRQRSLRGERAEARARSNPTANNPGF